MVEIPVRSGHPYCTYEMMQAQPTEMHRALQENAEAIRRLAAALANRRQIFTVGIGTSFHGAIVRWCDRSGVGFA